MTDMLKRAEPRAGYDTPTSRGVGGAWRRFVDRHLYDYNPPALRLWLMLVAMGFVATASALVGLSALPWADLVKVAVGACFVAVIACFPIRIPRTKYSIGVSDVFSFSLLALFGAPAAAIAVGAEGLVGAWRSSSRLTSRVGTPAVVTTAMMICGLLFEFLSAQLQALGWTAVAAQWASLGLIALPYFACSTLPMLAVGALKRGEPVSPRARLQDYSWLAVILFGAAILAGLLVMNARQFGATVVAVAGAAAAALIVLIRDALQRHEDERQLQEDLTSAAQAEAAQNLERFTAAFSQASIGMVIMRADGVISQANRAMAALIGGDEASLPGKAFGDFLHASDAELFRRRTAAMSEEGSAPLSVELRLLGAAGEIWVSLHCGRFDEPSCESGGLILQLHDISSRRRAEGQLHYIAYHDTVTDLANRACFTERLGLAVERSRVDPRHLFAVFFLDLDRFKVINDSLGHQAGNTVLQEVAKRLKSRVGPSDLVARLGGDELAVLVEPAADAAGAVGLAQVLLEALSVPLLINGAEVLPSASLGVTLSGKDDRTVEEILRDADLAMYEAKAGGRRRLVQFEDAMREKVAEKLQLEEELRRAVGDGQLVLVYQPLFELGARQVYGFEALVRWFHPERGTISPDVFIALAEENGTIGSLTEWAIDEAARQLAQWHAAHPRMSHVGMHVNVSSRDLIQGRLLEHVDHVLEKNGLDPSRLTLELTETTLMRDLEMSLRVVQGLRAMGVKLSIDDFGTGYSSMAYLSTLPIDSLKIDRSFVMHLECQPQNLEIVKAILMLGKSLDMQVIAEGIETVAQLALLEGMGLGFAQGYLLSRPIRADQVDDFLGEGGRSALGRQIDSLPRTYQASNRPTR